MQILPCVRTAAVTLAATVLSFALGNTVQVCCSVPYPCLMLLVAQELRKPSYAEICQRTRDPPPPPLQLQKEQKPNTVSCGKDERKPTETLERSKDPPSVKTNPGQPKDQRRQSGRRSPPPAVGKRLSKEQSTPPKSPQWSECVGGNSEHSHHEVSPGCHSMSPNELLVRSLQWILGKWDACKFVLCFSFAPPILLLPSPNSPVLSGFN